MTNAASKKFSDPKEMADWIRSQQTEMPALAYLETLKAAAQKARSVDVTSKQALRILEACTWPLEMFVSSFRRQGLASDEIAGELFERDEEGCLFPNINTDTIDRWERV